MNDLLLSRHARWVLPIAVGLFACVFACGLMFCLWSTVVLQVDTTGVTTFQESFERGYQAGLHLNTLQKLYMFAMFGCPPLLMVAIFVGGYFGLSAYQKKKMPPPAV